MESCNKQKKKINHSSKFKENSFTSRENATKKKKNENWLCECKILKT